MAWEEAGKQGNPEDGSSKDGSPKDKQPTQEDVNRFYGKWKSAEEKHEAFKVETDKKFATLADHNKKLAEAIEKDKEVREEGKHSDEISAIENEIEAVEVEIANAPEDEPKKLAALQMKHARLNRKYTRKISQPVDMNKIVEKVKGETKTEESVDPRKVANDLVLNDFKRRNPWYGKNKKMTYFAEGHGQTLMISGQYSYAEMLEKVAEDTMKEFPGELQKDTFGSVESGGYRNENPGNKDELDAEQKKMADDMGVSHEDWAKQLKTIDKGKK
jgi:hypothetical protein